MTPGDMAFRARGCAILAEGIVQDINAVRLGTANPSVRGKYEREHQREAGYAVADRYIALADAWTALAALEETK